MEWIKLIIPLLIGFTMGFMYFAGLWLTVKKMNTVTHPLLWMFSSFIVRIGILSIVFYSLLMENWISLAVALIGFLIARTVYIQRFKQVEKIAAGREYGI